MLKKKEQASKFEDLVFIYQEINNYLRSNSLPGISAIITKHNNLFHQWKGISRQRYASKNLKLAETADNIKEVHLEIDQRVNDFLGEQKTTKQKAQKDITQTKNKMQYLQNSEPKFAELLKQFNDNERHYKDLSAKYNTARGQIGGDKNWVRVLDSAKPPQAQAKILSNFQFLLLSSLLSVLVSISIFLVPVYLDKTVKFPEEIEQKFENPVLAAIPFLGNFQTSNNGSAHYANEITSNGFPGGEAIRHLRILLSPANQQQHVAILINSLKSNEGKSFIASQLAISYARAGKPTILIDSDLRNGVLHERFGCKQSPGLSDFLASQGHIDSKMISTIMQKTKIPNLYLIAAGKRRSNPTDTLESPRLDALNTVIQKNFSVAIFDSTAFDQAPDVFVLKRLIREALVVTRYGVTNLQELKEKINNFSANNMKVQGFVLNAIEETSEADYYKIRAAYPISSQKQFS